LMNTISQESPFIKPGEYELSFEMMTSAH
jgi:hypothetical protein